MIIIFSNLSIKEVCRKSISSDNWLVLEESYNVFILLRKVNLYITL